jgi:two-component system, NtrC family, response regulator AtoC
MPQLTGTVLIVDSDTDAGLRLKDLLVGEGLGVRAVASSKEALESLESRPFDVLIVEQTLADGRGTELLGQVMERFSGTAVVLAGAGASAAEAVEAMRAGAADFVQKPYDRDEIAFVLQKVLEAAARHVEEPPAATVPTGLLPGSSQAMAEAMALLERAALGTALVLVRGESGTGKELVARAIHDKSPRAGKPFVKIDCASLPETLLESELFGHEKGAFTGAIAKKPGRVELADGGTLFLDEIGELTLPLQAKLLRLLQDREFERLGSNKTTKVDVRVVAATHRDLETMVERGSFRQDLFYRLNVVPLWLPPLRTRRDDIELLAQHFCKTFGRANGKPAIELDAGALRSLRGQRWPGNVRQLQNFVERLVVLNESGRITEADVRAELGKQVRFITQPGSGTMAPLRPPTQASAVQAQASVVGPLSAELHAAERKALERALRQAKGNRSLAARLLGVGRSTLYAKLEEHGLL